MFFICLLAQLKIVSIFNVIEYLFDKLLNVLYLSFLASAVRKFKNDGTVTKFKDIEIASLMITDLLHQLRLCTVTGSLHTLFAHPPTIFLIFCPHFSKSEPLKRKLQDDNDSGKRRSKSDNKESINNTTGRKLFMPKGKTG